MSYNLSGCVFIRNTFKGAFCLFESMHQLLPLCDEFIVMDLGSDDGTLEVLEEIEAHNPKVKIVHSHFYEQDAAIFAKLANDLIAQCNYPNVLYYQADEIWHENLVDLTREKLSENKYDLCFWRVQLKYNFQRIKQFPQVVHRIAPKGNFYFSEEKDGMNTERAFAVEMVSKFGLEHFMQWGDRFENNPIGLPLDQMITDVSLIGAFLENIPDRRRMHLPLWHEGDVMPMDEGQVMSIDSWMSHQRDNLLWDLSQTPFNIPDILKYHLGRKRYTLRPQLLEALKAGEGWR